MSSAKTTQLVSSPLPPHSSSEGNESPTISPSSTKRPIGLAAGASPGGRDSCRRISTGFPEDFKIPQSVNQDVGFLAAQIVYADTASSCLDYSSIQKGLKQHDD
mmetsp:Transcript_3964/g.8092  ORF Transcript_3964/g.8092 Transcript_3964/m.8092 type:complete len:104 (-) Transcript_3964:306-617(-)